MLPTFWTQEDRKGTFSSQQGRKCHPGCGFRAAPFGVCSPGRWIVKISILATALVLSVVWGISVTAPSRAAAGEVTSGTDYEVLAAIRQGNLTVFPVVVASSRDTRDFLTLDEGLHSGEVVVTEAGSVQPLIRRRNRPIPVHEGAQVNQLVLVNNSKRPLLLLAGEIVTGGKQDRVIGKDRIVPAESDPVDLGVFCVEPGRWVGTSAKFGSGAAMGGVSGVMAAPSVRGSAMADKDQSKVWSQVGRAKEQMSVEVSAA